MRFKGTQNIKRENGFFHIAGMKIKALRKASNGYGVLVVFEAPTQLDIDFQEVLEKIYGLGCFAWFPTAKQLDMIKEALDLSDLQTRDWQRNGEGWEVGDRPLTDVIEEG